MSQITALVTIISNKIQYLEDGLKYKVTLNASNNYTASFRASIVEDLINNKTLVKRTSDSAFIVVPNFTLSEFKIEDSSDPGPTPEGAILQGGNAEGEPLVIGTLDSQPISIIINNTEAMSVYNGGGRLGADIEGEPAILQWGEEQITLFGNNAFYLDGSGTIGPGGMLSWDVLTGVLLNGDMTITTGKALKTDYIIGVPDSGYGLTIEAGSPTTTDTVGGSISLAATSGQNAAGGVVEIYGGDGTSTHLGGDVILQGGYAPEGYGGSIQINGREVNLTGDEVVNITSPQIDFNGTLITLNGPGYLGNGVMSWFADDSGNLANGSLSWDIDYKITLNQVLSITSPENENLILQAGVSTTADTSGNVILITASDGNGEAGGGGIDLVAGNGGTGINPQNGGDIQITAGNGANGGSNGRIMLYNQTEVYNGDLIINSNDLVFNTSTKGVILVDSVTLIANRITLVDGVLTVTPI